jgi:hypothetical protein
MSVKQKKMLGNFIAIGFVLAIILIIAFLSTIAYDPPQIPMRKDMGTTFNWGDVFKISAVNEYKYEIVRIKEGEIEKNEFFYDLDYMEGNHEIKIFPYEGLSKKEIDARIVFDNILYNCISKQYEGKVKNCEFIFPDNEVRIGSYASPVIMKKNVGFKVIEITSSIYREKIYESIKLESSDEKLTLWIIEGIPLPVRMEYKENDIITISNLKNYN